METKTARPHELLALPLRIVYPLPESYRAPFPHRRETMRVLAIICGIAILINAFHMAHFIQHYSRTPPTPRPPPVTNSGSFITLVFCSLPLPPYTAPC